MKNWKIILASLAALLIMLIVPVSAMAQSPGAPAYPQSTCAAASPQLPAWQGALVLNAPRIVRPAEDAVASVVLRKDRGPVEGVSIWAVSKEGTELFKNAFNKLPSDQTSISADILKLLQDNGNLLGQTDVHGKLTFNLDETGNYVLAAIKPGYRPAFSPLFVRQMLAIEAPRSAAVGADVNLKVTDKGSQAPVSAAGVWAVRIENPAGLKGKLAALKQAYKKDFQERDWQKLLDDKAISLGKTDENGKISASFETAGGYLLVTVKEGYVPGFAPIRITEEAAED